MLVVLVTVHFPLITDFLLTPNVRQTELLRKKGAVNIHCLLFSTTQTRVNSVKLKQNVQSSMISLYCTPGRGICV